MNKVKDYKGVIIYVNLDGMFYCDPINNSSLYKNKKFNSEKMGSIEKAIDSYKGAEIPNGATFYEISLYPYIGEIKELKVVSKVGERLFFNDNTTSSDNDRYLLYPESIKKNPLFLEIIERLASIREIDKKILALNEIKWAHHKASKEALAKLSPVRNMM